MLVLSRKKQEEIVIVTPQGEEIILKVIKINESSIRIGLEANSDYQIMRGELMEPRPINHQASINNRELALAGYEGVHCEAG